MENRIEEQESKKAVLLSVNRRGQAMRKSRGNRKYSSNPQRVQRRSALSDSLENRIDSTIQKTPPIATSPKRLDSSLKNLNSTNLTTPDKLTPLNPTVTVPMNMTAPARLAAPTNLASPISNITNPMSMTDPVGLQAPPHANYLYFNELVRRNTGPYYSPVHFQSLPVHPTRQDGPHFFSRTLPEANLNLKTPSYFTNRTQLSNFTPMLQHSIFNPALGFQCGYQNFSNVQQSYDMYASQMSQEQMNFNRDLTASAFSSTLDGHFMSQNDSPNTSSGFCESMTYRSSQDSLISVDNRNSFSNTQASQISENSSNRTSSLSSYQSHDYTSKTGLSRTSSFNSVFENDSSNERTNPLLPCNFHKRQSLRSYSTSSSTNCSESRKMESPASCFQETNSFEMELSRFKEGTTEYHEPAFYRSAYENEIMNGTKKYEVEPMTSKNSTKEIEYNFERYVWLDPKEGPYVESEDKLDKSPIDDDNSETINFTYFSDNRAYFESKPMANSISFCSTISSLSDLDEDENIFDDSLKSEHSNLTRSFKTNIDPLIERLRQFKAPSRKIHNLWMDQEVDNENEELRTCYSSHFERIVSYLYMCGFENYGREVLKHTNILVKNIREGMNLNKRHTYHNMMIEKEVLNIISTPVNQRRKLPRYTNHYTF